jgi:hypothetical protein
VYSDRPWLSREAWLEHGRNVCVPNQEAKDVVNHFLPDRRGVFGARHVFSEDQTVPVDQIGQVAA